MKWGPPANAAAVYLPGVPPAAIPTGLKVPAVAAVPRLRSIFIQTQNVISSIFAFLPNYAIMAHMKLARPKLGDEIPTVLVIFGVTGDLAHRKLFPALFDLYAKSHLPKRFHIVGFSRRFLSSDEFHDLIVKAVKDHRPSVTKAACSAFAAKIVYQQGIFEDASSYRALADTLHTIDARYGVRSNKLLYLAVPPTLYETILGHIAASGLSADHAKGGWTRVLVEKPFGNDLTTAKKLDELLGRLFTEEQIFRIDHYLAKEALQNILSFRFSNALFEPIWHKEYIEKVHISLFETLGVGDRGAYYDQAGALRDVGQNHLLQMLALVAMENPGSLAPEPIRKERARLLYSLRPFGKAQIADHVVRGQYEGYRRERQVRKKSRTETYFRLEVYINSERWKGIPFYLESGKKMKEAKTEITVYFRTKPCLCPPGSPEPHRNTLTFRVQPEEGISVRFWAKRPGFQFGLEPKILSFLYKDASGAMLPNAYERVLYDCIRGDQTLFPSTQEIRASWAFITPILRSWHTSVLHAYPPGSQGPITS